MCERPHEAHLKHAYIREGGFGMSATRKTILFVVTLLLGTTVWAQEFPRNEIAVDYSYA